MSQTGAATRFVTSILLLVAVVDVMLVAGAPGSPVSGAAQDSASDAETPVGDGETIDESLTQVTPVEGFSDVQIHIRVDPDRSATWSVKYRYRLANDSTEEAFERTRRNVTNPPGVFIERMRNASQRAQRRTDREMRVLNGTVSAYRSVPHGRFGIVEFRFTWAGFAATGEGDRLVVGDTLSGYPLGENESLVFSWADSFQPANVSPAPNTSGDTTVRWDGPHDFAVENPTLVLARGESSTPGSQSTTVPFPMVAAALVVVAALVTLGYGLVTGGGVAALGGALGDGEEDEPVPSELLSDEERVLQLVEDNGGRMKQQEVKDALDWSRTKTSNVVTDLQEAGKLEVYRLGRENTLALPEEMDL